MQHNEEFSHNVRLALHEHHVLWDTQLKTYLTLKQLKSAFDPLAKDPGPAEKASILGLADHTQKLANELTERLIKEGGIRDVSEDKGHSLHPMDTPAEEGLKEVSNIVLFSFPPLIAFSNPWFRYCKERLAISTEIWCKTT